jgi:hypothetical protein
MPLISSGDRLIRCVSLLLVPQGQACRAGLGYAQMLVGKVRIEGGLFEVAMSQQHRLQPVITPGRSSIYVKSLLREPRG